MITDKDRYYLEIAKAVGDTGGLIGAASQTSCWCIDTGCFK